MSYINYANYANIRGVSSNINAVHQHLQMERPHILAFMETQVSPDTNHIHLECAGYDLNFRFRHKGGLCVYARDDISCQGWRLWNLGTLMLCGSKSLLEK